LRAPGQPPAGNGPSVWLSDSTRDRGPATDRGRSYCTLRNRPARSRSRLKRRPADQPTNIHTSIPRSGVNHRLPPPSMPSSAACCSREYPRYRESPRCAVIALCVHPPDLACPFAPAHRYYGPSLCNTMLSCSLFFYHLFLPRISPLLVLSPAPQRILEVFTQWERAHRGFKIEPVRSDPAGWATGWYIYAAGLRRSWRSQVLLDVCPGFLEIPGANPVVPPVMTPCGSARSDCLSAWPSKPQ